jgi:hypothetical protein
VTGRDQRTDRPIEDLEAANEFRQALVERADAHTAGAPLWYGWAIFDAFLAGLDYARRKQEQRKADEKRIATPTPGTAGEGGEG